MPRRYHRPPAAKRRKAKKSTIPYAFEAATGPDDGGLAAAEAHGDDSVSLAAPDVAREPASEKGGEAPVYHIGRDYSYVRAEVLRILVVAAFLLVSLAITAVLRN